MISPVVSIVMPVYNAEPYLHAAIESILNQEFTHFELIVIDDGSTDKSTYIARSFSDARIRFVSNPGNRGIVYTLNRAIAEAAGRYIARMDGDDMSNPRRLAKQVAYLDQHKDVAVLASRVSVIDPQGHPAASWLEDQKYTSPESIRRYLPVSNPIAHPSIMARTEILQSYGYRFSKTHSEDYDLWLRLTADGQQIHKLPEELLEYRIHPASVTRGHTQNVFFKRSRAKLSFVKYCLQKGQRNRFVITVLVYALLDQLMGVAKEILKVFRKK